MNFEQVKALRPKELTSAAIQDAVERAKTERRKARQRAADLDAERSKGLLTASDEALLKMEADAAVARLGADRLNALLQELEQELADVRARDAKAERISIIEQSNRSGRAFAAAWAEHYEQAATIIVRLLQLEALHREDRERAIAAHRALEAEGYADAPNLECVHEELFGSGLHVMGEATQLPGVTGALHEPSVRWMPRGPAERHWRDGILDGKHVTRERAEHAKHLAERPEPFPVTPADQRLAQQVRGVTSDREGQLDRERDQGAVGVRGSLLRLEGAVTRQAGSA